MFIKEKIMLTVTLFQDGQSQIVHLPKEYWFDDDEVYINKIGDLVLLCPRSKRWEIFMNGVNGFSEDFEIKRLNDIPER